jgi:hypothetical protein
MAPGSQEATFLSEDEHEEGESSMTRVADKVPLAGQTKSVTSTDVGSPRESEAEDSSVSSKNQLRTRVYSLLREVAHVPLSSPPRLKKTSSILLITNWGRFPDRRVMDFKIFTLEITGKRTGTKPRKRRAMRRLVINLH